MNNNHPQFTSLQIRELCKVAKDKNYCEHIIKKFCKFRRNGSGMKSLECCITRQYCNAFLQEDVTRHAKKIIKRML